MPDDSTTPPPPQPPAGGGAPPGIDPSQLIQQLLGQGQQLPQPDQTPVQRSFTSLLGEAVGGGDMGLAGMSPAMREAAGNRSLLSFGVGMLAASGYHPVRVTMGEALAAGIQGAMQSEQQSQETAYTALGQRQKMAMEQQDMRLKTLQQVLPLLRMQAGANLPNPLAAGGGTTTGAPPNTSLAAVGGAAAAAPGLTGDKSKDLPIIAARESGGNPTALNYVAQADPSAYARGATASGKYQIVNSTWAEGMRLAGLDPSQYATARSAPEAVQDKVASALYDKYGTKPWDPTQWKQNWVQDPQTGRYALATAPYQPPPGRTTAAPAATATPGAPAAASPPSATTTPPAGPFGVGALTGTSGREGVAPTTTATAPVTAETTPPVPTVALTAARAQVAKTGKAAPVGDTGLWLQPDGKNLSLGPTGGGLGRRAAADALQTGVAQAQTTLPPVAALAAGPAAGGGSSATVPNTPAPTAFGGAAFGPQSLALTTTTPPAPPAPQPASQAQQPPAPPPAATPPAPTGPLTFEAFQQAHPITIDPRTYTVTPDATALQAAENAKAAAAQTLSLIHSGLSTADPNKATQAYTEASNNVARLQQDAQAKTLELQQKAQQNALDTQRQLYNDEQARLQAAALKAQELSQTAAENEKNRQNQLKIEQTKAGLSFHQQLAEQSATAAQKNTIEPMAAQAMKAHQMNLGLSQMLPIMQDLPPGGGALGTVLDAHPDLAPMFNAAGILNDRQADAVRLINGLVSNISTEMKPAGLGALREYEWDAFKAQLPSLMSTPAGQQKAVAMLMNMNNRIQDEGSWMQNYYNRKIPDETSATPGAMRPAHDLDTDGKESAQQRMDRELGPIVPRYNGPPSGSGQAQWEASLPPGKPYYKTWAVPDPRNPGQALRDANGNVRTTTTLEVRPWQ